MTTPIVGIHEIISRMDMEQCFELRKKLYENRTVLSDSVHANNLDAIPDYMKKHIQTIQEHVTEGQKLLIEELDKYRTLVTEKSDLDQFEEQTKSSCIECQKKITQLDTYFDLQKFDTKDLKNYIDEVNYTIGLIYELLEQNVKKKSDELKDKMQQNRGILSYLTQTYNILRGTTIGYTCPICMHNEVNVFCIPCGHSYCDQCMKSMYCHLCRRKITNIRSLYFP